MNHWECDAPGCKFSCVGVGGAVGLRAVGWYFVAGHHGTGPLILCPMHRPDGVPCHDSATEPDERREKCGACKAEAEAARWQEIIAGYGVAEGQAR